MLKCVFKTIALLSVLTKAQFEQELSQCQELEAKMEGLDLSKCSVGLEECILGAFDAGAQGCNSCIKVSGDFQQESNCGCIECIVSALNSKCLASHCVADGKNTVILKKMNEQLHKSSGLSNAGTGAGAAAANSHELHYFVDEKNDQILRPLLSLEKKRLVQNFLVGAKYHFGSGSALQKRGFPCDKVDCAKLDKILPQGDQVYDASFWDSLKSKKGGKGKEEDKEDDKEDEPSSTTCTSEPVETTKDDDDDSEEKVITNVLECDEGCTTTYVATSYKPKKKLMTTWKPVEVTITETLPAGKGKGKVVTKTETETATATETETELAVETKTKTQTATSTTTATQKTTETKTHNDVKTKTHTKWEKYLNVTLTETEEKPLTKTVFKHSKTTVTETNVEEKTKTRFKHDVTTVTETDFEVTTKTKFKHDVTTFTETELEETTKTVKVAKVTTTEWKKKVKLETSTTTTTQGQLIPTTATVTSIVVSLITVTAAAPANQAAATRARLPALSGIGFGVFNAENGTQTDYVTGYSTSENCGGANKTSTELPASTSCDDDIKNGTLENGNDSKSSKEGTFESSSSTNTNATKSWVISCIAALAGIVFVFAISEDRGNAAGVQDMINAQGFNPSDSDGDEDEDDEDKYDTSNEGAEYSSSKRAAYSAGKHGVLEFEADELIDSDIRQLLNASIPSVNETKEHLATRLVDDPIKGIAVV